MEEELTLSQRYEKVEFYNVLLDNPDNLLRYIIIGTYYDLLYPRSIFELMLKNIREDWYDTVNEWIEMMKEGKKISVDNKQVPLSILKDVFNYIDSVIQVYTNTMNPMEEENNQESFNYSKFHEFWFLYHDLIHEMILQFKKVDAILEEMEQEIQQEGESDIRIEETKPTLNEIDMTNEIKPIPKKKQKVECEDISDKYKPRERCNKPHKRLARLSHLFEEPENPTEVEEAFTEAAKEVFKEKDLKNEPLNIEEDLKHIKRKAIEIVLDGELTSKKSEPKKKAKEEKEEKKEKKEKPQKRPVPEPEKRDEPRPKPATVTNPLDAIRAAGLLGEENMDRVKEEQIKQEKFEKKEIDLTEPIEEINIKDELARKNEKTEKQKDVRKPRLSPAQHRRQEERKIKKQKENTLLDKDKQKVLQLIKKKEFTKIIPKSDDLKEILKTKLAKDPQIVVFLKVEELQKPESKWIVIDTPQQYLNGITFELDNKTYFVLGKKSVQVTLRTIEEVRQTIYNIISETIQNTKKDPGYESNKLLQDAFTATSKWIKQRLPTLKFEYIAHNLDHKIDMSTETMHFDGTLLYVRLAMGVNLKIDLSEFIG